MDFGCMSSTESRSQQRGSWLEPSPTRSRPVRPWHREWTKADKLITLPHWTRGSNSRIGLSTTDFGCGVQHHINIGFAVPQTYRVSNVRPPGCQTSKASL